ncbi:MAG: hypothetical protein ACRDRG_19380 [Pseudonocardiaceae bacterium]
MIVYLTWGLCLFPTARGSFLRGWRLLAIDGFEVDVPDTDANAAEFGYAGSGPNRSASRRRGSWRWSPPRRGSLCRQGGYQGVEPR